MNWNQIRDGDILLTKEKLIFYSFGYTHPEKRVVSYIKYVPDRLISQFNLKWLDIKWKLNNTILHRPQELYSPSNLLALYTAFEAYNSNYLYYSKCFDKQIITVPHNEIREVFSPHIQLNKLRTVNPEKRTDLQAKALDLIKLLVEQTSIPIGEFGIHGSLCIGIDRPQSDIDIAVYGSNNFKIVKRALADMVENKEIEFLFENRSDEKRKNKGLFQNTKFVINATRKFNEITAYQNYGRFCFKPIGSVNFTCTLIDSSESMFRPAIYRVENCKINPMSSSIYDPALITEIVSMIGMYRGILDDGKLEGRGMLEEVRDTYDDTIYYRVAVGSGTSEEYLWSLE